jgi:hypothetical protein
MKTEFRDKALPGETGTVVHDEHLTKLNNQVATGEDFDGSAPLLYAADTGGANAYAVDLVFGKKRSEGTNTSAAAGKLVDTAATFQTDGVKAGDTVVNVTDRTGAKVTAVDSETQLSLDADIFAAAGKKYAVGHFIYQAPAAYVEGQEFAFKAANANTGASTLDVNGLGAKSIKKNGTDDLVSGDIKAGQMVVVRYDGVNFQFVSPPNRVVADSLSMVGEAGASSALNYVDLNMGNVKAGDRLLVSVFGSYTLSSGDPSTAWLKITKTSGSSAVQFINDSQYADVPLGKQAANECEGTGTCLLKVTGDGTLTLRSALNVLGGFSYSAANSQMYAVFLKKQP